MTRRQSLIAVASLASAALLHGCGNEDNTVTLQPGSGSATPTPTPVSPSFVQPPVREARNGLLQTTLDCRFASNRVGGMDVNTRTFEGMIGGPTLVVHPGDTLRFHMTNSFPPNPDQGTNYPNMNTPHQFNTTNNHVHGLHVSPEGNSDNIFVQIDPGESFQYEYKLPADHPTGTFWYHPHKHGAVTVQMFGGMGAALIVAGPGLDTVPEVAAARDLVYLINELNVDPSTGMVQPFADVPNLFSPPWRLLTVNGLTQPVLTVQSGEVVRLRIINATVRSTLPLTIDGHELNLCAWDGITLPRVRTVNETELAVGGRVDVLIRGGAPGTYAIRKQAFNQTFFADGEVILGYLQVVGPAVNPPMALPTVLPAPAKLPDIRTDEITGRRTLIFQGSSTPTPPLPNVNNFPINFGLFDPNVINHTIRLNAVEEWTLLNTSEEAHPFHIHINPFQVISINDVPLPVPEWHDTVTIPKPTGSTPGKVVIRHRFQDFTGLYVLHCHILVHEDLGMMQTVLVTP